MPKPPISQNIRGQFLFLGTGTSHGIPVIGCACPTCTSSLPENSRTRCSVVLGLPEGNLLIDTTPEMRLQLVREQIGLIHAVAFTHGHADHLFGLDDLRIFPRYLGHSVPIFCEEEVEETIRTCFSYAFDPAMRNYPAGGLPKLVFQRVETEPFDVLGARVVPIPLEHGQFRTMGYRVGDVAYCTDTSRIPPESMARLGGLDVLILDCLRREPHVSHLSLGEAIEISRELHPKRTFLTHLCHHLEHESLGRELPDGIEIAYDGLRIPLGIKD